MEPHLISSAVYIPKDTPTSRRHGTTLGGFMANEQLFPGRQLVLLSTWKSRATGSTTRSRLREGRSRVVPPLAGVLPPRWRSGADRLPRGQREGGTWRRRRAWGVAAGSGRCGWAGGAAFRAGGRVTGEGPPGGEGSVAAAAPGRNRWTGSAGCVGSEAGTVAQAQCACAVGRRGRGGVAGGSSFSGALVCFWTPFPGIFPGFGRLGASLGESLSG